MKRYRGRIRFLGESYTYWTYAESKESAYFNFIHKLAMQTEFKEETLFNSLPIDSWNIHYVPRSDEKEKNVAKLFSGTNFPNNTYSAHRHIPKEAEYIVDTASKVFKIEYIMTAGVIDNEKDNRSDDRCTGLQSCLDEIIRLAQIARG
jgi:hypothetical protein